MTFNRNENYFNISVNDIFDELSEENKRLNNELMFANNCLNVFNKFKELLNKIVLKFETIIDSEDKQELKQLENEFNSVNKPKDPIIESNVDIECQETEDQINHKISVRKNKQKTKNINKKSKNIKQKRKKVTKDMDNNYEVSDGSDYEMDLIYNSLKQEFNPKKAKTKTPFVCTYVGCVQQFKYQSLLNYHIRKIHNLVKPFKCSECDKSYYLRNQLNKHQEIHLGLKYECNICHKIYKTETYLYKHQRNVHSFNNNITNKNLNNKCFSCDFCVYKTKYKQQLRQHINYHHLVNEKSVKCDYEDCHKLFRDVVSMKRHIKQYHKDKDVVCDWPGCGQTFKLQFSCDEHRLTHMKIRQFVCDFEDCRKAFFTKKTLISHKGFHYKKSVCLWPECEQRFNDKWALRSHMNIHLNLKPYKCTFDGCPKEYHNGGSLRFHLKTIHKNQ